MSSSEVLLEVEGLSAAWEGVPVLENVSFSVARGELAVLLGPNGSGKTTLLRCLAGLEPLAAGRVRLGGHDLAGVPPHRREVALMFQEPARFPTAPCSRTSPTPRCSDGGPDRRPTTRSSVSSRCSDWRGSRTALRPRYRAGNARRWRSPGRWPPALA